MTASDDSWHPIGSLDDLNIGEKKEFSLASGKIILLIHSETGFYACCADCPHQDTPLAEGILDGDTLTCPLHLWQWDIKTGDKMGIAELPLDVFELKNENGKWFVRT